MPDQRFAVLTDSACDMPYDLEKETGVDILNFGITVDGTAYTEREDFTFDEYYDILRGCTGVPATAHITMPRYLARFEACDDAGIEKLLYVSINATGSSTHDAALLAKSEFRKSRPASKMDIYIVDSHAYSMAYGWYVAQATQKLRAGEAMEDVVAWLNDAFTRVEIILGAFSLKFMKKSGRISAAAAIAGELLGVRPIISLNDGVSVVQKKVRGDKDVLPALLAHAGANKVNDFYLVGGTDENVMKELAAMCEEKWGAAPVCNFKLGAAVATNTGPDAIAIVFVGPQRRRPDTTSP